MESSSSKKFPLTSTDYKLYEEVGEGVNAVVYRALCIPLNEIVAIKILDLEKYNDLDNIPREVLTMSLINHPNLLRAHCSFIADRSLWIVMPFMADGSCFHIMKSVCPQGFEQPVIAQCCMKYLKLLPIFMPKDTFIEMLRLETYWLILKVQLSWETLEFLLACLILEMDNDVEIHLLELLAGWLLK